MPVPPILVLNDITTLLHLLGTCGNIMVKHDASCHHSTQGLPPVGEDTTEILSVRYTRAELVRMTGITHRQFERWRTRGLIPPALGHGAGSYYTSDHLDRLRHIVDAVVDGRVTLADLEERFNYSDEDDDL